MRTPPALKKLMFLMIILGSTLSFAHGEDRLGPHGGYIRMPGAYHTEVIPKPNGVLQVFLLDMEWKNPTTQDSIVRAELVSDSKKLRSIGCRPNGDHFQCEFPPKTDFQKSGDQIVIESTRLKQKGHRAAYDLPFRLEKPPMNAPNSKKDPHHGH